MVYPSKLTDSTLQVNRDPIAAEMQRMRQQIELLQAELVCARADGNSTLDSQVRFI